MFRGARAPIGRAVAWPLLAVVLAGSLGLKLNHLGHRSIHGLDEVFHAIVARNLLKHPLVPTLYEREYLPSDEHDWQFATVWMHKPPLPLWQNRRELRVVRTDAAGAAAAFGAARDRRGVADVPDRRDAVQPPRGFARRGASRAEPATFTLVHGYIFSDHVDVAMLFWTELGVWLVARAAFGAREWEGEAPAEPESSGVIGSAEASPSRYVLLAGVAQGLALLSKAYPALIITGLAIVTSLMSRLRARHVAMLLITTLVVIAPWVVWCLVRFAREFLAEQALILRHLNADVENWAGPWDRLAFDYLARSFHMFYPMLLAGMLLLLWRAWRGRDARPAFVIAWFVGVVIPHLLATSKTPSAALIGWPAGWILLAVMIDRALRGDALLLGAWLGAAAVGVVWPARFATQGMGWSDPPLFAGVMRQNMWVVWHAAIALAAAAGAGVARGPGNVVARPARRLAQSWLCSRSRPA
jgi:4-amino-4-deoxy-L-arabinose transferase